MKKLKISLLLLLIVQIASAEKPTLSKDFKVNVGNPYKVVDANNKEYFSDDNGHVITVKTAGEKVSIQRHDIATMKELSNTPYEDLPPYNKVQKVIKLGNKLFYIFSSFDKKAKSESIYSREINMATGKFEKQTLLFSTSKEVTVSSYADPAGVTAFMMGAPIRFEVHKSFDNSKLLIRYRLKPTEKSDAKNYDVLGFFVFNANLEKQWGGEVKMPYTEKVMNNLAYGVTKDGNAYMLAYINASKQFELLNITPDLKVTPNKIDVDGNLVFQELRLQESADGNLTCVGFYATGLDVTVNWTGTAIPSFNINGILDFKVDSKGKVIHKYDFEFPLELINQYESKRQKAKNDKREEKGNAGINDLKVIDVTWDADGSTTIIGEQQYMRKELVITQMEEVYYYGDVIAAKYDASGKIVWMKKLPKTQNSLKRGKGGLSVKCIAGKDASYFIFLDNPKNANIQMDEVPERHKDGMGGFLTAYKIDNASGKVDKHTICDIKDINGTEAHQFRVSRIFDAADKVFMLEIYIKGKEDTMVKMELTK